MPPFILEVSGAKNTQEGLLAFAGTVNRDLRWVLSFLGPQQLRFGDGHASCV